jgi:hypothetical protein
VPLEHGAKPFYRAVNGNVGSPEFPELGGNRRGILRGQQAAPRSPPARSFRPGHSGARGSKAHRPMRSIMMAGFIEARRLPDFAPGPASGRAEYGDSGDCAQTWRPTFCQSRASPAPNREMYRLLLRPNETWSVYARDKRPTSVARGLPVLVFPLALPVSQPGLLALGCQKTSQGTSRVQVVLSQIGVGFSPHCLRVSATVGSS